jgi:hypothetical protein
MPAASQEQLEPRTEVHICNSSYSEGRDQEDCGSMLTGQKVSKTPISTNKLSRVVYTYDPSYMRLIERSIIVQADPGQKT